MNKNNLEKGIKILKSFSKTAPTKSGVYKMISSKSEVLYIGKAKQLNKRIRSYANPNRFNFRLQRMVSLINSIECIITNDEANALLLEASLIKEIKPKFNILLKDDKSYPYITIRTSHSWAQIKKHRGKKNKEDLYFGPFASAFHVNITLDTLQKIFPLRTCSDFEMNNRKRPCLQYQIKRCTAPCTNYINKEKYRILVDDTKNYLSGKDRKIIDKLILEMGTASRNMKYEEAAVLRDKIRSLEKINMGNKKEWKTIKSADIFCLEVMNNNTAIEVIFCRNGQSFGSVTHHPIHDEYADTDNILSKFIMQFYNVQKVPEKIIVSHRLNETALLEKALAIKSQHKVKILYPYDVASKKIVEIGLAKAAENLAISLAKKEKTLNLHKKMAIKFNISNDINKIEVYDNSHFSGKEAIGSYIVASIKGFEKDEYRKYNIKVANTKDDYAMMEEVFNRRLKIKNNLPELVIVDGGKGQLSCVVKVFEQHDVKNINILSVSKGKMRNSNNERFFNKLGEEVYLERTDPVFYYLQRLRDEAHRYAISSHRILRKKNQFKSEIDLIEEVGPKRKKNLLLYFGSLNEIKRANIDNLLKVPSINKKTAEKIFNYFQGN